MLGSTCPRCLVAVSPGDLSPVPRPAGEGGALHGVQMEKESCFHRFAFLVPRRRALGSWERDRSSPGGRGD